MRIRCISTGTVRLKRDDRGVRRYLAGAWREEALPVNTFVIEHPHGACLLDTGQTAQAARPGYFPAWHPFFRLARFELGREDEVGPALRRLGLAPAALRWVVLSHLHTDHVGGLGSLVGETGLRPEAEVLVSRVEWERAGGLLGRVRGYLPQRWPPRLRPRLVDFSGPPLGPFAGCVDLAGDGCLVVVPTPGHTPGHMSLLVRTQRTGYLCAGDLAQSDPELAQAAPEIASFCRREGIVPLLTHDPGAARRIAEGAPRNEPSPL